MPQEGKFPNVWKRADLVIIKKAEGKDPPLATSYRPICLLKSLEKNTGKAGVRQSAKTRKRGDASSSVWFQTRMIEKMHLIDW